MPHANLILIGLRGSGKSTLGRLLAVRLGRVFVDLDALTPRELGCDSVADAWARHGEESFRSAEVTALRRVLGASGQVIAVGGGTPTAPGAEALLREARERDGSVLVYLRASPRVLRERLTGADNSQRPALTPGAADPLVEIEIVYRRRDPLYRALADLVLEIDAKTAEEVSEEIVTRAGS